jgi:putative acetyltransferase
MVDVAVVVRTAIAVELDRVLAVERDAFGEEDEAELVRLLLSDPTAGPLISLLAWHGERPVGHILITRAAVEGVGTRCCILAPLAVVHDVQRAGVGGELTRAALAAASALGYELMFVLGHPSYYPRHGFRPAGRRGFEAPYPIPGEHEEAWMVQELVPGIIGTVEGRVVPAQTMLRPEYWRE